MEKPWNGNNKIFSGYFRGSAKRPTEKIKDAAGHSFEEVSHCDSFGAKLREGFIDISFDDKEMSDCFLDMADKHEWRCLALENPENGHIHTYWKDTGHRIRKYTKDIKLACGLVADIHGGATYIPLRVNSVDRFPPIYDILPDEDYDEFPDELLPVKTDIKLWKSSEGDGRNSDLYRYILILQKAGLTNDRIKAMYRDSINPFILSDPLPSDELEVILRDESFEKGEEVKFFDGSKFRHDIFAQIIMDQHNIIKMNGQLHIYEDGVYMDGIGNIAGIMRSMLPGLKKCQKTEVLDYIQDMAKEYSAADAHYIAFQNGVLHLTADEAQLLSFTPDLKITNQIPWNYNPDAYDQLTDHTMNKLSCSDQSIRALLEECIGYCFFRENTFNKAFIMVGDKSNGKSTFLKVLAKILGPDNISSLDLKNLGDRFSKASLYGKLANIGDDISDEFIPDASLFKKITDGARIEAEFKGRDPFEFVPYAKLIFSANDIPRMRDKTGAVLRRLVIIPFKAVFSEDDADFNPNIKEDLTQQDAIEYLIRLGCEGLQRLLRSKRFTKSEKVEAEKEEYQDLNNPVIGFVREMQEINGEDYLIRQTVSTVYQQYQVYCMQNGLKPECNTVFGKSLRTLFHVESKQKKINGKWIRMYQKVNELTAS